MKKILFVLGFLVVAHHLYAQHPPHPFPPHPPHPFQKRAPKRVLPDSLNNSLNDTLPTEYALIRAYTHDERKELRKWRWRRFWSVCITSVGVFYTAGGIGLLTSLYKSDRGIGAIVLVAGGGLTVWGTRSLIKSSKKIAAIKRDVVVDVSPGGASIKYRF